MRQFKVDRYWNGTTQLCEITKNRLLPWKTLKQGSPETIAERLLLEVTGKPEVANRFAGDFAMEWLSGRKHAFPVYPDTNMVYGWLTQQIAAKL